MKTISLKHMTIPDMEAVGEMWISRSNKLLPILKYEKEVSKRQWLKAWDIYVELCDRIWAIMATIQEREVKKPTHLFEIGGVFCEVPEQLISLN